MGKVIYKCDEFKACAYPFQDNNIVIYFHSSGKIYIEADDGCVINKFTGLDNYKSIMRELSEL